MDACLRGVGIRNGARTWGMSNDMSLSPVDPVWNVTTRCIAAGHCAMVSGALPTFAGALMKIVNGASLEFGFLTGKQFDSWIRPEAMTHPLGGKQ